MAFMKWDDSFSVGVGEIDRQHQRLIDMINEFYEQIEKDPQQAFEALLGALVEYTRYHFSTEERYFRLFRYPDAERHEEAHRKFAEKVVDVRRRLAGGQLVVSLEVTMFLKEWLTEHIKGVDKAYSRYFNEHGLS